MAQPKIEGTGEGIPRMPFHSDGSDWYAPLVDSDGHIHIDIETSALPTDAATETTLAEVSARLGDESAPAAGSVNKQLADILAQLDVDLSTRAVEAGGNLAAIKTAVELIDDLRNALDSVATDLLRVLSKGGDKIFAFESVYEDNASDTSLSTGSNNIDLGAVAAGKVVELTHVSFYYSGTVPTLMRVLIIGLAGGIALKEIRTITSGQREVWDGRVFMQAGDYIRLSIAGATLNDDAYIKASGVQLNAP